MKNKTSEILSSLSLASIFVFLISYGISYSFPNEITENIALLFGFLCSTISFISEVYDKVKFKKDSRYLAVLPLLAIFSFVMLILTITGKYQHS